MTIFIIIGIAVAFYYYYEVLPRPTAQQAQEKIKREEKLQKKHENETKYQLIFEQFHLYIENVFLNNKEIPEKKLLKIFKRDFPDYKDGDPFELLCDLRDAYLIDNDFNSDLFFKGRAFTNLILVFPTLLNFLRSHCSFLDINSFSVSHHMNNEYFIDEAEISRTAHNHIANKMYIRFGVTNGLKLRQKLKISADDIFDEHLYFYNLVEKHSGDNTSKLEKNFLHHNYLCLEEDKSSSQYQDIFNAWHLVAKNIVESNK